MAMRRSGIITLGVLLHAVGAGCAPSSLNALLQPASEPGQKADLATSSAPYETAAIVSGTPTEVYALVARGVLGCWFGAGGPLKASHVFQAEAEPPAKGGAAEIVIHERDTAFQDRRGPRAYRVSFAAEMTGVRVGMMALKFEAALAQAMARDVQNWARGGTGCQLRAVLPPPRPPKGKIVKGAARKKR